MGGFTVIRVSTSILHPIIIVASQIITSQTCNFPFSRGQAPFGEHGEETHELTVGIGTGNQGQNGSQSGQSSAAQAPRVPLAQAPAAPQTRSWGAAPSQKQSGNTQKQARASGGDPKVRQPALSTATRRKEPLPTGARGLGSQKPARAIARVRAVSEQTQNFQRKLNFALISVIKQLHSSNVTNRFLS